MTASPVSEMPGSGSYAGRSHAEYQRALTHSRLVRVLKILLPLSAAFTIVAFVVVSWLDNLVPEGVGIESVVIKDGKLVMQSPVMSGQGPGARPYTMRAARAVQDLTAPEIIELEDIYADLPVSDGDQAVLSAAGGTFNRSAQTLLFDKPFSVTSQSGMSARLQSATIDLANGSLTSDAPVEINSSQASVVAQSMQMTDKGRVIVFQDMVRMTINPSALKPKDGATN